MEWRILFLGSVGAGKTRAIRAISDIGVVSTEEKATDATAQIKENTTVAMDMGLMKLGDEDRVVLYGAPGQERFDFMWEILLAQAQGAAVFIKHSSDDALTALGNYIASLRRLSAGRHLPPIAIGVTHVDVAKDPGLDQYREFLQNNAVDFGGGKIPVLRTDARERRDVRNLLLALTAMLEFDTRFRDTSHTETH